MWLLCTVFIQNVWILKLGEPGEHKLAALCLERTWGSLISSGGNNSKHQDVENIKTTLYFFTSNDLVSTCHNSNGNILGGAEFDLADSHFISSL